MIAIDQLKQMIDEVNYPYFVDNEEYLQNRIDELPDGNLIPLAKELCIIKSGIEEIKLGDFTIPSPRKHFMDLIRKYRTNQTRCIVRADEVK